MWSYNKAAGATQYKDKNNPIYWESADAQFNHNSQPVNLSSLQPGDLLIGVEHGATPLLSCVDLAAATAAARSADRPLVLTVLRGEQTRAVTIADQP